MSAAGATQPEAIPDGGAQGARPDGAEDDGPAPAKAEPQPAATAAATASAATAAPAAPAATAAPAASEAITAPAGSEADAFIPGQEEFSGEGAHLPNGAYIPDSDRLPDGSYYQDGEHYPEDGYYQDGEHYREDWELQPVSKLAVAALVSGLLALLPLALGFGIAALVVIRRTGLRGSRMALGGIYAAWIWVLIALAVGGLYRFTHGFQPQVHTQYRPVAAYGLQVGECFNISQNASGFTLTACGSPHEAEVYGRFKLNGTAYPGAVAVQQKAAQGCTPLLQAYVSSSLTDIGYDLVDVYPDSQAWAAGERTVICETRFTNGAISGSIRATG